MGEKLVDGRQRTGQFNVAVVGAAAVLDDATETVGVEGILELPERVAREVMAGQEACSPWQSQSLPAIPEPDDGIWRGHEMYGDVPLQDI